MVNRGVMRGTRKEYNIFLYCRNIAHGEKFLVKMTFRVLNVYFDELFYPFWLKIE